MNYDMAVGSSLDQENHKEGGKPQEHRTAGPRPGPAAPAPAVPDSQPVPDFQMLYISPQTADHVIEANRKLLEETSALVEANKILKEKIKASEDEFKAKEDEFRAKEDELDDQLEHQLRAKDYELSRRGISDEYWNRYNCLSDKAADPQTTSRLDPASPSQSLVVLFGTDSPDSFRRLGPLVPPFNLFGDTETRQIRNLLTKIYLVNFKCFSATPNVHQSMSEFWENPALFVLEFNVMFYLNEPDTAGVDSRFETDETFRSSLDLVIQIHSDSAPPSQSEKETTIYVYEFECLACQISNLSHKTNLQLTKHPDTQLGEKQLGENILTPGLNTSRHPLTFCLGPTVKFWYKNKERTIFPDGGWMLNNKLVAPWVINWELQIPREALRDPEGRKREIMRLERSFRQLISCMILGGYLHGVFSNGKTSFFVSLKLEAIQKIINNPPKHNHTPDLPIEIEVGDVQDLNPSLLQKTLAWNDKMAMGISEVQRKQLERAREFYRSNQELRMEGESRPGSACSEATLTLTAN